jgi:hypothetical protein
MIGLDLVVGVLLGAVPCRWEQVVHDDRVRRSPIGDHLSRRDLGPPMARSKNRRAARASRCRDMNTSMTWPNWSTARYTYRHGPATFT